MRLIRLGVLLLATFFLLGAASCSRGPSTNISDVAIATGINTQNVAENVLDEVPAGSEAIYLSAKVNSLTVSTQVEVRWYQLPSQLIAKDSFKGNRSQVQSFDFDRNVQGSYFASRIERQGVSWPIGEYRAEVFLNGQLVKTVFFNVISDIEAEQKALASKVQKIILGDALNSGFKVGEDKDVFARSTDNIYIQVNLAGVAPNTKVETNVRYIKEDQVIANFTSEVTGDKELVLTLSRERFGRLWADRLWPVGAFEVSVVIGGVQGKTRDFQVK